MNCREFKSNHVGFVDDVLSALEMAEMRQHVVACPKCATLDTRIRRSLLVVRNVRQIEPSADFFARLSEALKQAPPPARKRQPFVAVATYAAVTAALAAAVYFAMAIMPAQRDASDAAQSVAAGPAPVSPVPMSDVAIAATVPAGIPVWPAMFMVGDLPTQLANAELLDGTLGR